MNRIRIVVLAVGVVLSSGCGRSATDTIRLSHWSLRTSDAGDSWSIELPMRLDTPSDEATPTTYTFAADVRLPRRSRSRTLWFVVPDLLATSNLDVDGEPAIPLSGSPWDVAWTSGPHVFEIPEGATRDGLVRLTWTVPRIWRPNDWFDSVPEIHPEGELGDRASLALGFTLVAGSLAVGGIFMIGFAAFIVWARRRDRTTLDLALAMTSGFGFYAFQAGWLQLFGGTLSIHIVGGGYAMAAWFIVSFMSRWFGVRVLPRWLVIAPVAAILSVIVTWSHPSYAFVSSLPIATAGASYALISSVIALRPGLPNSDARRTSVWFAWIAFTIFGIPDVFYYAGLGELTEGVRTASVGVFLWGCTLQQALMSSRVSALEDSHIALEARALDARRENTTLETIKRDLERLARDDSGAILRALESTASGRRAARLSAGTIVDDRYEVLGTLGIGGMGSVYEVRRISDDERLALKVAHRLDGETLARLAREAWVAATVRSAQVIGIHDIGVAAEGFLFFVMERFPGVAASDHADRYGDIPWATRVLEDCARGLLDLHEARIVHRDLKPSNILVAETPDGPVAKLADFGISRFESALGDSGATSDSAMRLPGPLSDRAPRIASLGDATSVSHSRRVSSRSDSRDSRSTLSTSPTSSRRTPTPLTQTGSIAGTMAYMAPEVAQGSTIVAREADIFGFGVIAYEMLVGARPFSTVAAVEGDRVAGAKVAASIDGMGIPIAPRLLRALDACLSFDPRERPTAKELVRAFAAPR